ncbi:hypothetical protein PVV74_17765 [Roseovarius sp. SK2]|jgi:hypothetical protein|uniref:hypothetical protein n=1 Tax=Roseovarius TaxID=74030 RepID=UPI000CDDEA03|nr:MULTISPECIES: hypothetical protein [Roseovarius]MDD9727311.1 hypothetical protein [Roseovarius sp. SK2]
MSAVLDNAMIAAHEAHDSSALIQLYTKAADTANDLDASCFYLTHAYVFALEAGAPDARRLHARLVRHGREA